MMTVLKISIALLLGALSMQTHATSPVFVPPGKATEDTTQQPWVLIETHVSTEDSGGAIGGAFQEFTSKARCEAAIKLLGELAKRHRGGLGGSYKAPIAQCTPK